VVPWPHRILLLKSSAPASPRQSGWLEDLVVQYASVVRSWPSARAAADRPLIGADAGNARRVLEQPMGQPNFADVRLEASRSLLAESCAG